MEKSPLKLKTFRLALEVIKLYKYLTSNKKEYILSKQLLRSGTNPGAMICEAQNAESKADFIHKLKIAQKETSETIYWLELLVKANYIEEKMFEKNKTLAEEVLKMLISSINTLKKRN